MKMNEVALDLRIQYWSGTYIPVVGTVADHHHFDSKSVINTAFKQGGGRYYSSVTTVGYMVLL